MNNWYLTSGERDMHFLIMGIVLIIFSFPWLVSYFKDLFESGAGRRIFICSLFFWGLIVLILIRWRFI